MNTKIDTGTLKKALLGTVLVVLAVGVVLALSVRVPERTYIAGDAQAARIIAAQPTNPPLSAALTAECRQQLGLDCTQQAIDTASYLTHHSELRDCPHLASDLDTVRCQWANNDRFNALRGWPESQEHHAGCQRYFGTLGCPMAIEWLNLDNLPYRLSDCSYEADEASCHDLNLRSFLAWRANP